MFGQTKSTVLVAAVAAMLLAGCASSGVMVSEQQAASFKVGEATEAEVVAKLGKPTSVTTRQGQRIISYRGFHHQTRPETFIPYVGAFVGGADTQVSTVTFVFGSDGKLIDSTTTHDTFGTGTGFAAGGPIERTEESPRKVE